MSEHHHHEPPNIDDAIKLAELIAPRLQVALEPRLRAMESKIARVQRDINGLKAHSSIWGGLGGVLTSLITALPALLGKSKIHPLSVLVAWFRGH